MRDKDWVNCLPDSLLVQILSYLTTKDAVKTSILAKRWIFLWTELDCFDLDDSRNFWSPETHEAFARFVEGFFRNSRVSSIQKLRLAYSCIKKADLSLFHGWIGAAIAREVKELDICFNFFASKELEVLNLNLCSSSVATFPTMVSFSNLKILHLCNCVLSSWEGTLKELLSRTPILEELCLQSVDFGRMPKLYICSSTLRRLKVQAFSRSSPVSPNRCCVVIHTPNLGYLDVDDRWSRGLEVIELPLIHRASVSVLHCLSRSDPTGDFGDSLSGFLTKISNVKHLSFGQDIWMYILFGGPSSLPLLSNLTRLDVQIIRSWEFMFLLLESSPNLEVLTFEKATRCAIHARGRSRPPFICTWPRPIRVPKCLSSLQRIEIGLNGCESEIQLVGYLLKNATVLQTMVLRHSRLFIKKLELEIVKKVAGFSRVSSNKFF